VSEIELYLDELAERLAGTGDAGMRVLIEAEAHLYAADDDAMAQGLPEDQAEHEAVSRFGPPALVARKLRAAHGGGPVSRALSAAWLLAGSTIYGSASIPCCLSCSRSGIMAGRHRTVMSRSPRTAIFSADPSSPLAAPRRS
jgi:hypothetical protein